MLHFKIYTIRYKILQKYKPIKNHKDAKDIKHVESRLSTTYKIPDYLYYILLSFIYRKS